MRSPLLDLPGAVAGDGIDAEVAAHYGSFNGEQRTLESGRGFVDLSQRDVIRVEGPDRLTWLHSLTTQDHTEPGHAAALVEFLDRMRFMMRVEVSDVTADLAVTWRPRHTPLVEVRRGQATSLETPEATQGST